MYIFTRFLQSDAAATIFFTARCCAATYYFRAVTIQGQYLFLWKGYRHQWWLPRLVPLSYPVHLSNGRPYKLLRPKESYVTCSFEFMSSHRSSRFSNLEIKQLAHSTKHASNKQKRWHLGNERIHASTSLLFLWYLAARILRMPYTVCRVNKSIVKCHCCSLN